MKVAAVTGGGRGLGRAFAQALAAADHAVAVVARSAAELAETVAIIERAGGRAEAHVADVTDAHAVAEAFAHVEQSLGPIDLLVNNAGIVGPLGPFAESKVDDWWRTLEVNLRG
jgi:NAD(P)-dependent dehydrogenase (short-subunit alcohol dehydrogenase family)